MRWDNVDTHHTVSKSVVKLLLFPGYFSKVVVNLSKLESISDAGRETSR